MNTDAFTNENEKSVEDFKDMIFSDTENETGEDYATCVWTAYDDAYESDDEKVSRKFKQIYKSYLAADKPGRDLIDNTLISLCGYGLLTLLKQGEESFNVSAEENHD